MSVKVGTAFIMHVIKHRQDPPTTRKICFPRVQNQHAACSRISLSLFFLSLSYTAPPKMAATAEAALAPPVGSSVNDSTSQTHPSFVVGIIGLGDMGRMYARKLSEAGWR